MGASSGGAIDDVDHSSAEEPDGGVRPRLPWSRRRLGVVVAIVLAIALVATLCTTSDPEIDIPSAADAAHWYEPIWDDGTPLFGDICTQGVCVADLIALPSRRPVESAVDLEMPETLGAMSVDRLWTGERGGLFGPGWESIWDTKLTDHRISGPLPGFPLEAPEPGGEVPLAGGTILRLDDEGLVEAVCADGALCVTAERSQNSIVLTSDSAGDVVTLELEEGRVVRALTASGRSITYGYTEGRLTSVDGDGSPVEYSYDAGGRLASIDDGDERTFTYDSGLITGTTDRDGDAWTFSEQEGEVTVEGSEGWRKYRFEGPMLVEVEDSTLGTLLRRTLVRGSVSHEERPVDGITTTRLDDGRLQVSEKREGAPSRTATLTTDAQGRVVRSESIEGATVVTYDGSSPRPKEVEHAGGKTTLEYDDHGLLMSTIDADGYRVDIARDARGLATRIHDGMVESEFSYDDAGRVIGEKSGEAQATATYSDDGLLSSMVDAGGREFTPTYDEDSRLTGLDAEGQATGEDAIETLDQIDAEDQSPSLQVRREGPAPDGGTSYTYMSGDSVTYDASGRPITMVVDGRMTTREYDEAGRVRKVRLPDGTGYSAEYSRAGRVTSIESGDISASLTWHGDLLIEAQTSAGSTYHYEYDKAGNLISASAGAARWLYEYNQSGLTTAVHGPGGVSRYTWDDLGRPTRTKEAGVDRRFAWHGDGLDLADVTDSGNKILDVERDGPLVVSVTSLVDDEQQESTFEYDTEGRVSRYRLPGDEETEITYSDGQVSTISIGNHREAWSWKDGEVSRVTVGEDGYDFEWASPGLVRKIAKGGETLARVEFDERGRPTAVFSDDDEDDEPTAAFSWTAAGVASARFDDWDLTAEYDEELRITRIERDDQVATWSYARGALRRIAVDGDQTTFDYGENGRLERSERIADDDETETTTWDDRGSHPTRFTSKVGSVDFAYDSNGMVDRITIDDGDPVKVETDDGKVRAEGDAGRILEDLFDNDGDFDAARSTTSDGPVVPWFDQLPAEFGLLLPDVVTAEDVVSAATAEIFPTTPMPLASDGDAADIAARSVIGLATGMTVPIGPGRAADLDAGPEGADLEDLLGASPSFAVAASSDRHLGPGPSLWSRVVGYGEGLLGGVVTIGSATWGFLTENPVGRAVLKVAFLVGSLACGVSIACALGVGLGSIALGVIMSAGPNGFTAALNQMALQPLDALRSAARGEPMAVLSVVVLVASLRLGARSVPVGRVLPARATAHVCKLKPLVCVSASKYGAAADHVADAQRNGASRLLRLDRSGATARRRSALRGIESRTGFDRDEYPPALSIGRGDSSVRHIDPNSNRSLGAYIGHQLSPLPDGARFSVLVID